MYLPYTETREAAKRDKEFQAGLNIIPLIQTIRKTKVYITNNRGKADKATGRISRKKIIYMGRF